MRKGLSACIGIAAAATLGACTQSTTNPVSNVNLGNPDSLSYVLLPGAPAQPQGVMLTWVAATDPNVTNYVVYGRADSAATWGVIAYTGETEYFDLQPAGQYYISSEDGSGDISSGTTAITVDTTPPMPPPGGLAPGAPLDSAVALSWNDSVRVDHSAIFNYYRVYSEAASGATCPTAGAGFGLEGTTVSEDFVVTGLPNGTAVCYGVTTVSQLGQESVLSPWVMATPTSGGGTFDITSHPNATVVMHRTRAGRLGKVRRP
jgi:hypothetical protein